MEVGPRLSFTTAWSANAVSVCKACALPEVTRIERSRRFLLSVGPEAAPLEQSQLDAFAALVSKLDLSLCSQCVPSLTSYCMTAASMKNVDSQQLSVGI